MTFPTEVRKAFNARTIDDMMASVRSKATNLFDRISLTLSPDEFIQLFIKPEHVQVLKDTEAIVGFVGNTSTYCKISPEHSVWVTPIVGKPPILIPKYASDGLQPTAPESTLKKLRDYINVRTEIGCRFGECLDALVYLNDKCDNIYTVYALFPAIATILNWTGMETNEKRAKKVLNTNNNVRIPVMPRESKTYLLELSAFMQSMTFTASGNQETVAKTERGSMKLSLSDYKRTDQSPLLDTYTGSKASFL